MRTEIDFSLYDFIDFGCSRGDSMELARKNFSGGRGIGLDINPKKVYHSQMAGYEAIVADVTKLEMHNNQVRFVIISHFLEHLSGKDIAAKCIQAACLLARDFVYIQQPFFDADGYLFSLGLKFFWSDDRTHGYHMTSVELYTILRKLLLENIIKRFAIYNFLRIENSSYNAIHSIFSPSDQTKWVEGQHPPKPYIIFNHKVFRETRVLVALNEKTDFKALEECFKFDEKVFDSSQMKDLKLNNS